MDDLSITQEYTALCELRKMLLSYRFRALLTSVTAAYRIGAFGGASWLRSRLRTPSLSQTWTALGGLLSEAEVSSSYSFGIYIEEENVVEVRSGWTDVSGLSTASVAASMCWSCSPEIPPATTIPKPLK